MSAPNAARIRELNDAARSSFTGCAVMLTAGVDTLDADSKRRLLTEVRSFDRFEEGNDPHAEHDFGAIELCGSRFFFKFDYYDRSMTAGSEDPADPEKTTRVLTIMCSHEY